MNQITACVFAFVLEVSGYRFQRRPFSGGTFCFFHCLMWSGFYNLY